MAIVAFEVSEDKVAKFIVAVQCMHGDNRASDYVRSNVLRGLIDKYIGDVEEKELATQS